MIELARELRTVVELAAARLRERSDAEAGRAPAPGKWSPKQVVGHLVDSAANNQVRFVRACLEDDLVFPGYDQDRWVATQGYEDADWSELLDLWEHLNRHVARVIAHTPHDVASQPRSRHNLDRIAWETVTASEPVTLAYFMRDYVGHLAHHLRQIDPDLAPEPRRQRDACV